MINLLMISVSPIFIVLIYIYIKDKYEKEPKKFALKSCIYGMFLTIPIIFTENFIQTFIPLESKFYSAYMAFGVAGLIEEGYKFLLFLLLIYKNKNYNEPFDGILYAVFISLGFACIENIAYVLNPIIGGFKTGFLRSIFSIPAHAMFGVYMGYFISRYKFLNGKYIILSLIYSIIIHGLYDLTLFVHFNYDGIIFILIYIFICISSIFMMKNYIKLSPFKKKL